MGFKQIEVLLTVVLFGLLSMLSAGCDQTGPNETMSARGSGTVPSNASVSRLNPDNEPDSVSYPDLLKALGPLSKPGRQYKLGIVVRFFGNPYYQLLIEGMDSKARELGVYIDYRAGAGESDQLGQCAVFETMIDGGYDAILISPQTDVNLITAVRRAREKGLLLINIDSAVVPGAEYYVGPNQYESGAIAARYLLENVPGGKVVVIKGLEADYGVNRRTQGFLDTISGSSFQIIAEPYCVWDLQIALQTAAQLLEEHPDISGFFCSNDIMALGVAQAVRNAGRSGKIVIIGRDGIGDAYDSIRAGAMTATVSTFPSEIGKIAIDVAVRVLQHQRVPRVVITPQELLLRGNMHSSRSGTSSFQ